MAAENMASCSGVTVSSFWPIADSAVVALSGSSGKLLCATGVGIFRFGSFIPYFSAMLFSVAEPSCMPMLAKAVLQDSVNAVMIVALLLPRVPQTSPSLLIRWAVLCGSCRLTGASTTVFGLELPCENAAELVTILKVEPGG